MQDWLEILKEEENKSKSNDNNDDYIELPEPEVIDLNADGSLQKKITYEYDKDDHNIIYRVEQIIQIKEIQHRVSESALNRKRNWKKFGQVADIPKGTTERGVTSHRPTSVPFIWTIGPKEAKKNQKPKPLQLPIQREEKKNDDNASEWSISTPSISKPPSTGGYRLSKERQRELMGMNPDGEPSKIKISNLPQWCTWDNIKQLIDAFYRNHLRARYIPRDTYKVKMVPSQWTLDEWNSDPIYYKYKLENYERMAFVEFQKEKDAQLAIKILNGHRYEYCVLCVEKAQPRNNNNYSRSR